MKPFTFSLKVLLRIRENREQSALQEYACLLADYSHKTGTLNALRAELDACCAKFSQLSETLAPAVQFVQYAFYRDTLAAQLENAKKEVSGAEKKLHNAWNCYLDFHRDREIISLFQDKQRRAYDTEERLLEQRDLDELVGRSFQSEYLAPEQHPEIWN